MQEANALTSGVVVTGAASGIGRACAEVLAASGRAIALWDLNQDSASKLAGELSAEHGIAAVGLRVDVADPAAIHTAAAASREAIGAIGGLVHAAGMVLQMPVADTEVEAWDRLMNVNLRALLLAVQALLPDLEQTGHGAVVGIGSINATLGNGLIPAYSASKGGMISLVRSLADDLGQRGVRINTVSPGQIRTPMLQPAVDALPEGSFERRILLGRLGEPGEVANAVAFLLSDLASYITASELVVDGGNISSQR
ncbi:SDR family NAD(P)-dependent oxidoreductase [Haliea sp. E1-2-M8]|uniref:SDR family NAD(P)-dependent oxidoreductase n=1 Tax=Haliea sp. E1-2-M8 TaxID=3064706 RepID=UPI002716A507|nr:SDR family NAD(P)-dependent oxidoreductase [Haliea sp. E1-2-M8]MDO8862960.1 SDR family NAD(P)-dependent oxidoreductase [Haliea sp. E1-2-M8]